MMRHQAYFLPVLWLSVSVLWLPALGSSSLLYYDSLLLSPGQPRPGNLESPVPENLCVCVCLGGWVCVGL